MSTETRVAADRPGGIAVGSEPHQETEQRVTPLELFFDLVFVFALTQVTGMLSEDPTWGGLGRAMLVLAALWWTWAAYAWLTNTVDPDEGGARLAMLGAMAAMLIVSLAVPGAFGSDALLFGIAYLIVRILHIVLYAEGSPEVGIRTAILRLAPSSFIGAGLIILAAFFDGPVQAALWFVALAIDYGGPLIAGPEGFTVSPHHFAERFGLVVIIALGESIVAVGVGAAGLDLDAGLVGAAVLGIGISAALWWAYFDVVAVVAERRFAAARGRDRILIARDSYSYLHLPMIAGIVLLAVGIKKTVGDVDDPLKMVPAVALCGGVALYLLGHIAFRLRNMRTLSRQRLVAAALCLALLPLATEIPALAALGVIGAICWTLIAFEAIHLREARRRVRAAR